MKISGEFRRCGVCHAPLSEEYPEGTNFTFDQTWWGDEFVTVHTSSCPDRHPVIEVAEPEDIDGIER